LHIYIFHRNMFYNIFKCIKIQQLKSLFWRTNFCFLIELFIKFIGIKKSDLGLILITYKFHDYTYEYYGIIIKQYSESLPKKYFIKPHSWDCNLILFDTNHFVHTSNKISTKNLQTFFHVEKHGLNVTCPFL